MGDRNDINFTSEDGVNVYAYFVDVADISKSLGDLKNFIIDKLSR